MVVATTLVTACPPSLFLETPLYSHYHLFLRSFLKILSPVAHASLFSSPCPARFPPEETSLPPWKVQTRWQSSGFPILPSSSFSFSFFSWNKRGTAQSRQKISKSLDKGVLETPFPSSLPPSSFKLQVKGLRGNGRGGTLDDVFYICRGVELTGERGKRRQVFGNEILFQDCKINRERSPGLTLDWILTLWKCLIDIISRTNGEFTGGKRGGMLGWFTRDWRRRVLFPTPLEMLSGFNVWLSSNGWTKFVREWWW